MSTTTIRVTLETRERLSEMAQQTGLSMQAVIERALEAYRRQQMLTALNDAYASLKKDTAAWQELEHEREVWDTALADGLEDY